MNKFLFPFLLFSVSTQSHTTCPTSLKTSISYECGINYFTELFRDVGCEINLIPVHITGKKKHWLNDGDLDFLPGLTALPERQEFLRFTKPYAMTWRVMVVRKDDKRFDSVNDWCDEPLKKAIFIVRQDIHISREIDQLFDGDRRCAKNVVGIRTTQESNELLRSGVENLMRERGDVLIVSDFAIKRVISNNPEYKDRIKQLPIKLWMDQLSIGFNRHSVSEEFVKRVNIGIDKNIKNGILLCDFALPPTNVK